LWDVIFLRFRRRGWLFVAKQMHNKEEEMDEGQRRDNRQVSN